MTLGTNALASLTEGVVDDEWEDPTLPTGLRARAVTRPPLARGTVPPQGQEEPASAEDLDALRGILIDAGCTALETVMRVMRWEMDELEAFTRETGVSPGDLFQPGLVRAVLDIKEGPRPVGEEVGAARAARSGAPPATEPRRGPGRQYPRGRLAGLALDGVGAAVSERLAAAGARSIRPMARAFAGLDGVIDRALAELASASRRAREGATRAEVLGLHAWAVEEKVHAAAIHPVPGKLTNALLGLWVVKSCDGPARPRAGVDEVRWRSACLRLFGVAQVPPVMMARLQLEAMWIDMGLAINGAIDWPAGGAGVGAAVFTYAANPRALATSLAGHSKDGERYRHLAAGGPFSLRFRFTVREPVGGDEAPAVAQVDYELDLDAAATR
jgi:hypothetical protein